MTDYIEQYNKCNNLATIILDKLSKTVNDLDSMIVLSSIHEMNKVQLHIVSCAKLDCAGLKIVEHPKLSSVKSIKELVEELIFEWNQISTKYAHLASDRVRHMYYHTEMILNEILGLYL